MHCNSFIILASGLVGVAVAPPPALHKPVITALGHNTASSSIPKVTPLTHTTDTPFTTVGAGDIITATIIEIGEYPPEEVWTTIHRGSLSATPKAQETSKAVKAVENNAP